MVWNGRGGEGEGGDWGCVHILDWSRPCGSSLGTFLGYVPSLVASEAEPLFHMSVSFFKRHSVCGPDVFYCIWVTIGGWGVPQFDLRKSESLLHVCVFSEMSRDSFKLSPLVVKIRDGGIPAFKGGQLVFLLKDLVS